MRVEVVNHVVPAPAEGAPTGAAVPVGLVTVLVSCCGQQELTRLCVASLLRHCRPPYDLHFLDSGSLDGTSDYLAGVQAAAPVRVAVSRVGPASGGRKDETVQLRGEYVVLLNNDTIVTEGWLASLVAAANRDSMIGMVAPMSNHAPPPLLVERVPYGIGPGADGPGEDGGGDFRPRIAALERFAREWREHNAGKFSECERLGGGCVLVKRKVLQALGMFPTRTALGSFDTDGLSQRARQAGFRLGVCAEAFIHHFGSRSPAFIG